MSDRYTTNHEKIQSWIQDHDGFPARIRGITDEESENTDAIEISFSENPELERIEWDEFFDWVEHNNLALRYTKAEAGNLGSFEFVDRIEVMNELSEGAPDSGDEDVVRENTIPDVDVRETTGL